MLGDKIYALRKEKNISQEEFAEVLNTSRQAISKWERNDTKPDIDKLIDIANYFNVSVDYLLDYEKTNSSVEKIIQKIESNLENNTFDISIKEIKLWYTKHNNNFNLLINIANYLLSEYSKTRNEELLDLLLQCYKKGLDIYSYNDNQGINQNDLHAGLANILKYQKKYQEAKDYLIMKKVFGYDYLIAHCDLNLGNYNDALKTASMIYLDSISQLINTTLIQINILLSIDKLQDAYDLTKWGISFIDSIKKENSFFNHIIFIYNFYLFACDKLLNKNSITLKTIKELQCYNSPMNKTTDAIKFYHSEPSKLFSDAINVEISLKEFIDQVSLNKKIYRVLLDAYNEVFGGENNESNR